MKKRLVADLTLENWPRLNKLPLGIRSRGRFLLRGEEEAQA